MRKKTPANEASLEPAVKSSASRQEAVSPSSASPSVSGSTEGKKASPDAGISADASAKPARTKAKWPRLTVIIVFAIVFAYDLFEAISNTFGVADQITRYNENATLIGINTIAVPWVVLIVNLLLPIAVFFFALVVARKRNFGILAIILCAGLGVVAALSLTLGVLAGVLAG